MIVPLLLLFSATYLFIASSTKHNCSTSRAADRALIKLSVALLDSLSDILQRSIKRALAKVEAITAYIVHSIYYILCSSLS